MANPSRWTVTVHHVLVLTYGFRIQGLYGLIQVLIQLY